MTDAATLISLPLEKKIGQLFFIGISGPELDSEALDLLEQVSPGGICLFARNVRSRGQVRKLLDDLRQALEVGPFLSLDQEGGLVDRLRRISTPMPSARSIVTVKDAKLLAGITAEIISMLGFNMNFAPVVDVVDENRERFSNGLHSRAFGRSREEAAELAAAYLAKLQQNGIVGCLKHFPGLGAAEKDAHEELPQVNITNAELFETDLLPYRQIFAAENVGAVMIAHASFPNVDLQETGQNGKLLPSSLSYNFVTKLLREELGFENLAITDDLEMGAVVKNYGIGEACKMAVNAGNDLLAICANPVSVREGFEAILAAATSGEISEERIDRSLRRIASVRDSLSNTLTFDDSRLDALSDEVAALNKKLTYSYGG